MKKEEAVVYLWPTLNLGSSPQKEYQFLRPLSPTVSDLTAEKASVDARNNVRQFSITLCVIEPNPISLFPAQPSYL